MSTAVFSPFWYRVSALRPQIKAHALIHRHEYRRRIWYVLQDRSVERFFRFTPATYFMIGLMNGQRTIDEIWSAALARLGDAAPTQEETIRLLGQLYVADVLQADVSPDVAELFARHQLHERHKWKQRLSSPLSIRIPLLDPDRALEHARPVIGLLFSAWGFLAWLVLVGAAIVLAGLHWTELTTGAVDRLLAPQNLLLIWLLYPLIKALHELGHAFALKAWGGEVHEVGILFLVLMPVPYVEASAAAAFTSKRQRMIVGAAGMMVELALASFALLLWLNVEPGLLRTALYNIMLIGGISTIFFNGNPLLRYDGYYLLSDAIEIPNLAMRSRRYLDYLAERYLFGMATAASPVMAPGERPWLAIYGVASFLYRTFVLAVIVLFVAGQFFVIGVALAIWAVLAQIVWPLTKFVMGILNGQRLRERRGRAIAVTTALAATALAVLFAVPAPLSTVTQGVVWLPERGHVTAGADGFVKRHVVEPGQKVAEGDPLFELADPQIDSQVRILEGRVRELEATFASVQFSDRSQARVIEEELATVQQDLASARDRLSRLIIRSPSAGTLSLARFRDLVDRFVRRGDVVAYVVEPATISVRTVVGQDRIGLVREGVEHVDVWLADIASEPAAGVILRGVPAATDRLPSQALATTGGGPFPIDPRDPSGLKSLERLFLFDLAVPDLDLAAHVGARAYVRLDHGTEPLGIQAARMARQLFLSRFGV